MEFGYPLMIVRVITVHSYRLLYDSVYTPSLVVANCAAGSSLIVCQFDVRGPLPTKNVPVLLQSYANTGMCVCVCVCVCVQCKVCLRYENIVHTYNE